MIDTMLVMNETPHRVDPDHVLTIVVVAAYPSLRAGLGALLAAEPNLWVVEQSPAAILDGDTPMPAGPALLVVDQSGLDDGTAASVVRTAAADGLPVLWIGERSIPGAGDAAGGRLAPAADRETLIAAVWAVAAGLRVLDPRLPATTTAPASPDDTDPLSPREHEVLALVAAGHPNKAIARTLGISEHTVKFHVSALLGKLGATSRTEAVTLATRRGLLSL